ncbi:unnamed protein product [Durusdinium trenchii]|uniref:DNA (cytosine-5-)-methyltransferase n=1 Tax=Durusdinium trenchii TaxID=1381693 RepID=A0ABP0RUL4_9DINO
MEDLHFADATADNDMTKTAKTTKKRTSKRVTAWKKPVTRKARSVMKTCAKTRKKEQSESKSNPGRGAAEAQKFLKELKDLIAKKPDAPMVKKLTSETTIQVGSDCSGLGSELVSLATVLGGDCGRIQTKFVSESDATKRLWLQAVAAHFANETPEKIYKDLRDRQNAFAPETHLFVTGAPCPPYSQAGLNKGLEDLRGDLILRSLSYVVEKRPVMVLMENVKNLASEKHKKVLHEIASVLRACGYKVQAEILNTQNHGIPQNRERVYVIAILKSYIIEGREFSFPQTSQMAELKRFLNDETDAANSDCRPSELCQTANRNIRKANKQLKKQPTSQEVIVDAAAGKGYFNMMVGVCPCITKARGGERGFYLLGQSRYLNVFEQGRLQGWHPKWVRMLLRACDSKSQLGKALGDAMSLNILQRLLPRMLYSVGLLAKLPKDNWAHIPAHGPMPSTLYDS